MANNGAAFASRFNRLASSVPVAEKAGLRAAGLAAKSAVLDAAKSAGWNPGPRWVSVRHLGVAELVELRGARAYWAERGTKPHTILAKGKAMRTPYGPRASVQHPGARPRPFWQSGTRTAQALAGAAYSKAAGKVLSGA